MASKKMMAGDQARAFENLFYHLIVKGLEHEHKTGRAPMPRTLQFRKDQESTISDDALLANLKRRLEEAAKTVFSNSLYVEEISAHDSKKLIHIQLTDLFTGAINRRLNFKGPRNHKDEFADYLLSKFNISPMDNPSSDMTTLFTLS